MINNLDLALAVYTFFGEQDISVSREVFFEIVLRITGDGQGHVTLNIPQASEGYPFIHRANWRGANFVYFSREMLSNETVGKAS
ncbi:MAG TPA: hypothetical protein VGP72_27480 [Planctomycetota bacterium]